MSKQQNPAPKPSFYAEHKDTLTLESNYQLLEQPLTVQNYREKFHYLLCWEQQEHERRLRERCNSTSSYDVTILEVGHTPSMLQYESNENYSRFGYITCDDDDALEYAKQSSAGSKIYLDGSSFVSARFVHGSVPGVFNAAILIAFAASEHEKLKTFQPYGEAEYGFKAARVEFELTDFHFNRLHKSLELLSTDAIAKLNPTRQEIDSHRRDESCKVTIPAYESLNLDRQLQLHALYTILQSPPTLPVLVSGPFGTGKTRLLVRAAYEILKKSSNDRVLICAYQQASVDTFLKYFGAIVMHHKKPWRINVIRLIPNESMKNKSEVRRKYSRLVKTKDELSLQDLKKSRLVITTYSTSVALFHKLGEQRRSFFTAILMDEGAQTNEPETVIPLCLAGPRTQIVIAGDHCQVGPRSMVLGEVPQSKGLALSLLERLHMLYGETKMPHSQSCSVSLLINHRCHSGILMLPSSLYYHSTLQCRVPDSIAHHLAPFPLTFVCSDITKSEKSTGVNKNEADVLIEEVKKYINEWPKHWRKQDKVCIMSPSSSQCTILRKKVKKIETSVQIEVLKAYNIQGNEFRAVFISTSEATTTDGQPLDKTRSLCDRYVFNTALTRSQSLVVAVGNPFLLLKIEASMAESMHGKTWTPYIRQCVECSTFSYAKHIQADPSSIVHTTYQLYDMIYSDSVLDSNISKSQKDVILGAYDIMFKNIRACKTTQKILDKSEGRHPESRKEVGISESYPCILTKETYRLAEAKPEERDKERVTIRGSRNLRGAFDGERVVVEVFADSLPGERRGRVQHESVLRGENLERDLKFVCRVSEFDTNVFYPIDGKNPGFYNLRILTKVVLKDYRDDVVVIFDPSSFSLRDGSRLPRIVRVIPRSVALDMLFIVTFVKWGKTHHYPLGLVVDACRKGHTPYNAEHLLKLEHSVKYSPDDNDASFANAADSERNPDLSLFDRAFTIDPPTAKNLDDALSITRMSVNDGSTVYQLGVHIVNAAEHIKYEDEIDILAKEMGISLYGGKKGQIKHMLPNIDIRRKLSLTPGKIRDVLSVTCTCHMATPDHAGSITFDEARINPAQIKSAVKLTYKHAQNIMNGSIPSECSGSIAEFDLHPTQPSFQDSIRLLYHIAMTLRRSRLSDAAYAYSVDEPDDMNCWNSHLLVEELMIWANNEVAKKLRSDYPDAALLCQQLLPSALEEKRQAIVESQGSVMKYSFDLSQYCDGDEHCEVDIAIPCDYTLGLLHDALRKSDKNLLIHLLSSNRFYPQFSAIDSQLRSLSSRAEYCCAEERYSEDPHAYRHYSLRLDNYTHFTSPMRRYIDIEVQRMLLAKILNKTDREFTNKKQSELCCHLNAKKRGKSNYEKRSKQIYFASSLLDETKTCIAFISKINKGIMEFDFPDLELRHFSPKNKSLRIARFFPSSKESDVYLWKLHITSVKSEMAKSIFSTLPLSRSRDDSDSREDREKTPPRNTRSIQGSPPKMSHKKMPLNLSPALPSFPTKQNNTLKFVDDISAFCLEDEEYLSTEKFVSDPSLHAPVVQIPAEKWLRLMEFVKNPTEENMEEVKKILPPQVNHFSSSSQHDLDRPCPFMDADIKSSLKQSDVMKLWLTWSTRDPWISSTVQLVEVSPLLHICMQHNCYPAECFSHPNLTRASKESYYDMREYIELWKRVLLAEAAEKSVQECQPVIIRDVRLDWPEMTIPDTCIDEIYYTPERDSSIELVLPKHFAEHCHEFFRIGVGDLVCVRYGCDPHQSTKAVYHLVVHHVDLSKVIKEEDPGEITVSMKPMGEMNCRVSEVMKGKLESKEMTCEVQLITLGYSYRKVFRGLLALTGKQASKLSKKVATDPDSINYWQKKRLHPRLQNVGITTNLRSRHIAKTDELARSISNWTTGMKPTNLNEYQEPAMYKALDNKFQLIQGPPGTGKSVTGARIAYVFAKSNQDNKILGNHKCVLYCGPSNKSVDVVFEKFAKLLEVRETKLKILRIYSSAVERKDFRGPKHYTTPQEANTKCPEWAKPYALHHMLRQEEDSELVKLESTLKKMRKKGKIPTGKLCNRYRRVLRAAEEEFLEKEKFDIVFCTCNEASGGRMKRYKNLAPRQCIIDECGMAYEPETIVPISLCEHVVLIGDHKQLQPVIDYQPAKDCGLTTSLFERFAKHYDKFLYTLEIQYRMHMSICSFPSEEFYENKLRPDESVLQRKDNPNLASFWPLGNNAPIMFVNVVGTEGQDIAGSKRETRVGVESKYNEKEAKLVLEIARTLVIDRKVNIKEIAVLSPYSAQKNKILEMRPENLKKLTVASITESQGDEYGIVILSTVRSQPLDEIRNPEYMEHDQHWMRENLGFITDRHQINVGITRSKYGLVITGNKALLKYDGTWRKLLKHYENKKSIVEASRFIS